MPTNEQLYRKVVSPKGRVTYERYTPPDPRREFIDQEQAVALLTVIVLSMLMATEDQYPPHSRLAREINNVGVAVTRLSKLNNKPLDSDLVDVGVKAWNATIDTIMTELGQLQEAA